MASLLPRELFYQIDMKEISAQAYLKKKESGEHIILIDVREEWEALESNIGGKCYPLGELPNYLVELERFKQTEIIVHCKSGDRSKRAQKYLTKQGFEKVFTLVGGIQAVQELVS